MLRYLKVHGPILLVLLVVVFVAFGHLMTGTFSDPLDLQIIQDAHLLAHDPWLMFGHIGAYFSQLLLQIAFLVEYSAFGLHYGGYIGVNLVMHTLNAFIVYMLVNLLFFRPRMALLAALLFSVGVGSYGRLLQSVTGLEGLLLGFFHLLVLYLFIRNDFRGEGRVRSWYFLMGLLFYGLAGLTKASTMSILGCLIAYKAFFYVRRGRRTILSVDLIVFLVVGLVFQIGQAQFGYRGPTVMVADAGPVSYTLTSVENIFRYLNLMLLPLQESNLLAAAGPVMHKLFEVRILVYPLLTLAIVSFSVFGFVFGNNPLRFFIAWTFITLLPFSGFSQSGRWLNLGHLYLASLGFCVTLSAGALGTFKLLAVRRWRRYLAFALPILYAAIAISLTHRLDARNRILAATPRIEALRAVAEQTIHADDN